MPASWAATEITKTAASSSNAVLSDTSALRGLGSQVGPRVLGRRRLLEGFDRLPSLIRKALRHGDFHLGQQIAGRLALARNPAALDPQHATARSAGRQLDLDR